MLASFIFLVIQLEIDFFKTFAFEKEVTWQTWSAWKVALSELIKYSNYATGNCAIIILCKQSSLFFTMSRKFSFSFRHNWVVVQLLKWQIHILIEIHPTRTEACNANFFIRLCKLIPIMLAKSCSCWGHWADWDKEKNFQLISNQI